MSGASFARTEDEDVAAALGVSLDAVQLARASEVIDLHLESWLQPRLFGTKLETRQTGSWLGRHFFGHLDYPRALDGGLTAAMWSIATNVLKPKRSRFRALLQNVENHRASLEAAGAIRVVTTHAELLSARRDGQHAALLAVQGGNAYEGAPDGPASVPDGLVTRVTLMHLTDSVYGRTSSPLGFGRKGLREAGKAFVEQLNAERIFVDLAHVDRPGFWDAVEVHDRTQPLIVTHTGVCGVTPHWRNLDDDQVRAVADTGGVIGVLFAGQYLRRRGGPRDGVMVLEHLEHIAKVAGDDAMALGSDFDGFITPPKDIRDGFAAYYRLVQGMLERGWSEKRIRGCLGENFLRSFAEIRPG